MTQLSDWLFTTDPATRTTTRTVGTGATTETETISGSLTTFVTEVDDIQTYTITGNDAAADGNYWYGTATPPCVSTHPKIFYAKDYALIQSSI
jgi:hypothetical protein